MDSISTWRDLAACLLRLVAVVMTAAITPASAETPDRADSARQLERYGL